MYYVNHFILVVAVKPANTTITAERGQSNILTPQCWVS
ncbi:hypothetical protein MNBD_PLANCTO02-1305 [hydrothermal vent metagenome]|uniref:Uncharacterized protein n=1 Tax=hydrothermal vent metagenome TaxID=652676 RepID=A0A3B1DMI6_9ZZZZ